MLVRYSLLLLAFICCLLLSGAGLAHPFHTSLTEIEYNAKDQNLELAIKLAPVDLEEALSAYSGSKVVIVDTEQSDALIHEYLQRKLRFYSNRPTPQGAVTPLRLDWVGKQLDVNVIWVFLTVPVSETRLRLDNQILLEIYRQQINTVSILHEGKKQTQQLTGSNTSLILSF